MDYLAESSSPRRFYGIAIVLLLHAALIYALVNGLGSAVVDVLRAPVQVKVIAQPKPPPEAPPPPPPPQIHPTPPYIPPPLIQLAPPPAPPPMAEVTQVKPPAPTPVARPRPVIARGASLDPNQSCAAPQYPEQAQDMGETGTTMLQFLIGTNGAVVQARVATSSGHAELDQAALQALAACKFKPAVGADGSAQEDWVSIPYVWTLN